MKKLLSPIILILTSSFFTLCNAQQDYYMPRQPVHRPSFNDTIKSKHVFFSFNLGFSVPLGNFGSKDTSRNFMVFYARSPYVYNPDTTNGKGYANPGFHAGISLGVFLVPDFGLAAKVSFSDNSVDEATLNSQMSPADFSYTVYNDFQVWQFMAGGFGNIQLTRSSWLWAQLMLGLIHANFPSFSASYYLLQINETLPDANDLAYSFSLAWEKQFAKNLSFVVALSYTGAQLLYSTVTYQSSYYVPGAPPSTYVQNTPVTMPFSSLDITAGLLFRL